MTIARRTKSCTRSRRGRGRLTRVGLRIRPSTSWNPRRRMTSSSWRSSWASVLVPGAGATYVPIAISIGEKVAVKGVAPGKHPSSPPPLHQPDVSLQRAPGQPRGRPKPSSSSERFRRSTGSQSCPGDRAPESDNGVGQRSRALAPGAPRENLLYFHRIFFTSIKPPAAPAGCGRPRAAPSSPEDRLA